MSGEIAATSGSDRPKTVDGTPGTPVSLKFITWDTNGLDRSNLRPRSEAVCSIIRDADPDVVFLQGVVFETYAIIWPAFRKDYRCVRGHYWSNFTFTMLKKATTEFKTCHIRQLKHGRVLREVATIEASFAGLPITLINAALESDHDKSKLRKKQLSNCFKKCLRHPANRTVIFGGNLGLRGHELSDVGGRPRSLVDVWEHCGRWREVRYTWDMVVNDNNSFDFSKKPQYRPDRVYLKASKPATMMPVSFDLIGMERLSPLGCFPSDHWGVLCRFNVF
ncbi:tyrosyl-DNA phosphodiesterase 2-like [Dermacentor andersoni]|uniref:tyrosyl-DNA phosphodiesterase 2-like n=1 Tax=Dermacentor andersoni TaxID=34620 RepID=UPI0024175EF9|nr:tyrosyl-DNA phosphodiesterase 2-like [Dermacentor andersoni]